MLTPEEPTLAERLVLSLRLPYSLGCLVLAILLSTVGPFIGTALDTMNLSRSFVIAVLNNQSLFTGLARTASTIFLTFALLFLVRYMRLRVVEVEKNLASTSMADNDFLRKAFGVGSHYLAPVGVGITIVAFYAVLSTIGLLPRNQTPPTTTGWGLAMFEAAYNLYVLLVLGTFIWVYFSSLRGFYRLGAGINKIIPPSHDPSWPSPHRIRNTVLGVRLLRTGCNPRDGTIPLSIRHFRGDSLLRYPASGCSDVLSAACDSS
jgi:hypothetical protein